MFVTSAKKRGRPPVFGETSNLLLEKKRILFENSNSNSQYMSLISIAYHTNKISQEEYNIAIYLENLFNNVKKILEVKTIPNSTPYTWTNKIQNKIITTNQQDQSIKTWYKISSFLESETNIHTEFLKLICEHHSYEELLAIKTNQKVMNILKQGLKSVKKLLNLGY